MIMTLNFDPVTSNVSGGNNTKMLRPRPRPAKQQQKTLLLQHECYEKITWYKNVKK